MEQDEHADNNDGNGNDSFFGGEQRHQGAVKRKAGTKHKRGNPNDPIREPGKWLRWLLGHRRFQVEIAIAFVLMLTTVVIAYFNWLNVQSSNFADRPYIQISVTAEPLVPGEQTIGTLDVTNVGRTPALDLYMTVGGSMALRHEAVDHVMSVHGPYVPHHHGPFQLAPGEHRTVQFNIGGTLNRPYTKTEYDLVTKRIMPLYMFALFRYRDVFGHVYNSDRFCFEYVGHDPKHVFQPCDDQQHDK